MDGVKERRSGAQAGRISSERLTQMVRLSSVLNTSKVLLFCSLFVCRLTAQAQGIANFTPAGKEFMGHVQVGEKKPFVECNGSFYLVMQVPTLTCGDILRGQRGAPRNCIIVWQYADQMFDSSSAQSRADELNGVQRKESLLMSYTASRTREVADGVWGRWGRWNNKQNTNQAAVVVIAEQKNNQKWDFVAGPEWAKILFTIDQLVPSKPLSCSDITNPDLHETGSAAMSSNRLVK